MAQNRPCDVSPTSDQDKYSVALVKRSGEWYGLDVPLFQIFPSTQDAPAPVERVSINSFHAGRGHDRFVADQYGFYDSLNGWSTTPGKFHATLQQRWARGLRNADFNMPKSNKVSWKKITGGQSGLAVSFVASASYTATQIILLIRKSVPAGTQLAPGDLHVALFNNNAGVPGTFIDEDTISASAVDVVSQYYVFTVSAVLTVGQTYWIEIYSDLADKANACWEVACDPTVTGKKRAYIPAGYSNTTFAPYYRVTDSSPARQYRPFMLDGCLYLVTTSDDGTTASKLYLNGTRGRATGTQSASTLQDTSFGAYGATLPTDRFVGSYIRIIRGTGRGQVRQITANNGNTFTVSPNWVITPVSGSSEYVVFACDWFVEITGTGLGIVTGPPIIQNGIVYFPQGDGTVIRKMRIDYADADDHAFGSESTTNQNKAYFLDTSYDASEGPQVWRANQSATSGSTPNAAAISVSRASSAPNNTPVGFTTDLTFKTSLLAGENTNLITNIHEHENALYVFKEDGMFLVEGDRVVRVKMGVETAPDPDNGRAAVTAGDKNLYVAFRNDVYLITGSGAYSTNLKNNLPSNRSGPIHSLIAAEGWVFAAINGGDNNYSSVMKFSLDTKTWSEQLRGIFPGFRIRNLQWQPCPETRPRLWLDCQGDMMFQEFPINGVRPFDDKEVRYEHEAVLELPTIDLNTTDPKYFAVLSVTTQGLPTETDTESGHVIVVECQTDNDIGTTTWEHVDYIKKSPTASVVIARGNKRMIRPRLRLISDEPIDPVILETISLSLFTRGRLAHEWSMQFPIRSDDEEQNSVDLLMWLRDVYSKAEPLTMKSRFTLFHDRLVTLADEPRYQLEELDAINSELEAQVWMKLVEVI
jgi:hypothetical protein